MAVNSSSANRLWEITFLLLGSNLLPSSIRQFNIIVLRGGIWKNGSSVTGENHQLQIHNIHTQIVIDAVWTWEKCQEGPPTIIKIGFYFWTLKVICYHFLLQFLLFFKSRWVIFLMSAPDREINSNFSNLCFFDGCTEEWAFFSLQRMFGSFDLSPNSNIIV